MSRPGSDVPVRWLTQDGKPRARLQGPWEPDEGSRDRPVLLVHGLTAASNTFLLPADGNGLAGYLRGEGFDVWLLDWRGSGDAEVRKTVRDHLFPCSGNCVRGNVCHGCSRNIEHFTLDSVARYDHGQALEAVRREYDDRVRVDVVAHCVGAGSFAMCLASEHASGRVRRVLLSTLSLFSRPSRYRQYLIQDYLLERTPPHELATLWIDPYTEEPSESDWPEQLAIAWEVWKRARFGPFQLAPKLPPQVEDPQFLRLSFLYGEPFDYASVPEPLGAQLEGYFGHLNLGLAQHVAEITRRGAAATATATGAEPRSYLDDRFADNADWVTLLTGNRNLLWHRDSCDRMEDWLRNRFGRRAKVTKIVLPDYAHQDLYWAPEARERVYPLIRDALQ